METATCGERNHYLWRCIGPAQGKETTMTFESRSLEVFQDCALFDSPGGPPFIRDALLTNVVPPWRHNREREEEASKHTIGDADIMVFERAAADELPSGCLFLFSTPNGYEVSNIVPTNPGQLGYSKYNALLQNFVTLVVNPATERANFKVRLTAPHQSINDWVSSRCNSLAAILRRNAQGKWQYRADRVARDRAAGPFRDRRGVARQGRF